MGTTKSTELEDSKVKLKKLSSELSSVLTELKKAQEGKLSSEQENKGKYIENDTVKKLQIKLKHKSDEKNLLLTDIKSLKEENEGLNERVEFYIGQCSEFEINIKNLNDEIYGLQLSIKESNNNYGIQLETLLESKKILEDKLMFMMNQKDLLFEEDETVKAELESVKTQVATELDAVNKYNLQCGVVEELLKKHEKLSAQLRRKDWEIENYQRKLDSAFEAEMMIGQCLPPQDALGMDEVVTDPEDEALDLSNKNSTDCFIIVKVEEDEVGGESHKRRYRECSVDVPTPGESHKRRYSECSVDVPTPASGHGNLDTSCDSK